jgi:hypothetical protein
MKIVKLPFTTDSSGAATVTHDITDPIFGLVYAVQLVDGTLDDGVDVTVTIEEGDLSIPVLVKADFNTDQMVYPRVLQALNTDGTALTTHTLPIAIGQPKVVIAQGGDVKSGAVILYFAEI